MRAVPLRRRFDLRPISTRCGNRGSGNAIHARRQPGEWLAVMRLRLEKLKEKLLGIHDSEHRIALGAALGLLLGVLPGTGPIAAVAGAFLLRANKAAALAGSLLVNTWINFVTFPLAAAIGAFLWNLDLASFSGNWAELGRSFTWRAFVDVALHDAAIALFTGYLLIGLLMAAVGYVICYRAVARARRPRADRAPTGAN